MTVVTFVDTIGKSNKHGSRGGHRNAPEEKKASVAKPDRVANSDSTLRATVEAGLFCLNEVGVTSPATGCPTLC